jgi:hypothetical protein
MRNAKVRYIPVGSVKVADKLSDAVAYVREANGAFYAMVYYGNQSKPAINYRYSNATKRAEDVKQAFASRQQILQYKKEQSDKRKAWINDYQIGDVLGTHWGYDQTNREFYEVVSVKGKSVQIRRIAASYEATSCMTGNATPCPGSYIGEAYTCRATAHGVLTGRRGYDQRATRVAFKVVDGKKVYEAQYVSSTH